MLDLEWRSVNALISLVRSTYPCVVPAMRAFLVQDTTEHVHPSGDPVKVVQLQVC